MNLCIEFEGNEPKHLRNYGPKQEIYRNELDNCNCIYLYEILQQVYTYPKCQSGIYRGGYELNQFIIVGQKQAFFWFPDNSLSKNV